MSEGTLVQLIGGPKDGEEYTMYSSRISFPIAQPGFPLRFTVAVYKLAHRIDEKGYVIYYGKYAPNTALNSVKE